MYLRKLKHFWPICFLVEDFYFYVSTVCKKLFPLWTHSTSGNAYKQVKASLANWFFSRYPYVNVLTPLTLIVAPTLSLGIELNKLESTLLGVASKQITAFLVNLFFGDYFWNFCSIYIYVKIWFSSPLCPYPTPGSHDLKLNLCTLP